MVLRDLPFRLFHALRNERAVRAARRAERHRDIQRAVVLPDVRRNGRLLAERAHREGSFLGGDEIFLPKQPLGLRFAEARRKLAQELDRVDAGQHAPARRFARMAAQRLKKQRHQAVFVLPALRRGARRLAAFVLNADGIRPVRHRRVHRTGLRRLCLRAVQRHDRVERKKDAAKIFRLIMVWMVDNKKIHKLVSLYEKFPRGQRYGFRRFSSKRRVTGPWPPQMAGSPGSAAIF